MTNNYYLIAKKKSSALSNQGDKD